MNDNPAIIEEERAKRDLLTDQPKELLAEVVPFYTEGVQEGLFSPTGGGVDAAKADFEFYTEAGQMEGPAESLKVEDFWDPGPLNAAKQKLGLRARGGERPCNLSTLPRPRWTRGGRPTRAALAFPLSPTPPS